MTDDQTFRLILMLGMAAVVPVGLYHRVRPQASRERLDRRQEGLFILLTLRPIGLAGMCGLFTYLASPGECHDACGGCVDERASVHYRLCLQARS